MPYLALLSSKTHEQQAVKRRAELNLDGLAFGRNLCLPAMHFLDARLQGLHLVQLAVH